MTCQACRHYLSSEEANKPRSGLLGYGYCKAAPSLELRARLFPDTTAVCWLDKKQFMAQPQILPLEPLPTGSLL
jgi:hypothetical protein